MSAVNAGSANNRLPNTQDGAAFVEGMYKAAEALNDYTYHYSSMAFKHGWTESQQGIFYFKKPHLMRVEVTSGSRKGSVVVVEPNGKIKGHMGGLLRGFKATLSADNDMLKLPNGYPMMKSDIASLYAFLQNMLKNGDHSLVTKQPISQDQLKPTYIVDIYSQADVPIKRVFVDPASKLPVMWYDYTDGKLTSRSYFEGLRTNVGLSDKLFTM